MAKNDANWGVDTRLAHGGNDPRDFHGFVNPPVVHASTVLYPNAGAMASRAQKYTYGTRGTPTTDALASAIDALEGSAGTIVVPSGLAAVTIPLLAFAAAGDHVLIVDSVYHPTRHFADTMLTRLGVEVEYYDPRIGAGIAAALPLTETETEHLGEAGDALKERAQEFAGEQTERAKEMAERVARAATDEAREQKLTPEDIKSQATAMTEKVGRVVDASKEGASEGAKGAH